MSRPRLFLSHDCELDWLTALEFGRVDDAQPPDCWEGLTVDVGLLRDPSAQRVVGFKVLHFSRFVPDEQEVTGLWDGPRFDVPVLGLADATVGEVVLGARAFFGARSSLNRTLFAAAVQAEGSEALELWRRCLEAGDAMAHFGLGCALLESGDPQAAYRHLRHYTEIAPHGAWNWRWYGHAAEAAGELSEARRAYERAVLLEQTGEGETDAGERLRRLARRRRFVLWGDEHPRLGRRRVEAVSDGVALGLTAGERPKGYAHEDPNEDVVAAVVGERATLLVCADGHNGAASSRAAVEAVLDRWDDEPPLPAEVADDELVAMWQAAGKSVRAAGAAAGQPESRTTLVVALVAPGEVRWAAMGDSTLAVVGLGGEVRFLGQPRHLFVGWPMTDREVAQRLRRGYEQTACDSLVVLASDGLHDFVRDLRTTLASAVAASSAPERVVDRLLQEACTGGAGDNVALAVTRLPSVSGGVSPADRVRGCLLGGAVGDALGAGVEFASLADIRERFGPGGVTEPIEAYGRVGAITDDTQMALFTAEGLLRAWTRSELKGLCHTPSVVDHAYARWLATQGERSARWTEDTFDGWLIGVRDLHGRRAPGTTCLSALRAARAGTIREPLNGSKGCGGVMRVAPAGLLGPKYTGDRFELGCELAALTHGDPTGYLAAGALTELVAQLVDGRSLAGALDEVERRLVEWPGYEETLRALRVARALAAEDVAPSAETLESLGEGWVAEEALGIAVYCALVAHSFEHGVLLAVNHSGDSDSTGAITGNLLGALLGAEAIPARWFECLELRGEIDQLLDDWLACFGPTPTADVRTDAWLRRYPGG